MTERVTLLRAAKLFDDSNLAQHVYVQGLGSRRSYCTTGAVNVAAGSDPCHWTKASDDAIRRLDGYLISSGVYAYSYDGGDLENIDRVRNRVFFWNDAAGRTKAEVVEALRGAAWDGLKR